MSTYTYTYTDRTGYVAPFEGEIQMDRSGIGAAWTTMEPSDVHAGIMAALAEVNGPDGEIVDGAEATVGGAKYRAIAE